MAKKIIAANWKMNGSVESVTSLIGEINAGLVKNQPRAEVWVTPPLLLLSYVRRLCEDTIIRVGAQNCHARESGAFTGETSPLLIKQLGGSYVLLGHSERRRYNGETDTQIKEKAQSVVEKGITAIVCVGETLQEREEGLATARIREQIRTGLPEAVAVAPAFDRLVVAYEPVWAIGAGKMASSADIAEVHTTIRLELCDLYDRKAATEISLLYGGSVKADNAREIACTDHVDGALVGGASLKADDFLAICHAFDDV